MCSEADFVGGEDWCKACEQHGVCVGRIFHVQDVRDNGAKTVAAEEDGVELSGLWNGELVVSCQSNDFVDDLDMHGVLDNENWVRVIGLAVS